MTAVDVFDVNVIEIENGNYIHLISIEDVTDQLKQLIDDEIVNICEADVDFTIDFVKSDLSSFFKNKDKNTTMGAVAEFIIHLYLKTIGYRQECLYRNLEEGSIKKGFDGYYSFLSEEWIMESKSGSITTEAISHKKKLKEAYSGLKAMLAGETSNNPWKNALNHAKRVGSKEVLIKNIRKLTLMYNKKEYPKIKDLNIIPASTIYHDGSIKHEDDRDTIIIDVANNLEANKINAICIDKKSIQQVVDCLTK